MHVLRSPPDDWNGETGYLDQDLLDRYLPARLGTRHYSICANPKMMDQVEQSPHTLGVPIMNVHLEHYNLA